MNRIIVNLGNVKLDEIPLQRGSLNIGRATDNDISLADAATSAHHAKIVTIFTSSFIQDLNSTNGTIVNGRKVVRHTLHHGDIISIGNLQLLFKSDVKDESEQAQKTISIDKHQINSLLEQSKADEPPAPEQNPTPTSSKDSLSGFSISVPTDSDTAIPTQAQTQAVNADEIPVLDETLPLSELRKNPDRMVVLTPKSTVENNPPVGQTKSVQNSVEKAMSQEAPSVQETEFLQELEPEVMNDEEQIRRMLLNQPDDPEQSPKITGYFITILVVILVLAIIVYALS